jgi:catechol 2,3-dioxygenase-like lactoylglutathione lyase family enzyme
MTYLRQASSWQPTSSKGNPQSGGNLKAIQQGLHFKEQTARIRALAEYRDFLTLWKDADPDIPILQQAKAEYANSSSNCRETGGHACRPRFRRRGARNITLLRPFPVTREPQRTLSEPISPFELELMYNPPMQGIPWSTIALGSLLLISGRSIGGQDVQSPQPEKSKPPIKMEQRGRILGIGGVFFKSANRDQMREWYSKHLGLADKGQGAMLPWREHDDPQKEHVTVWTVFPASTKYFDPSSAPFMINYIVDDMDALLDRLKQEGVKIDAKRMDESYGRFAWIYDLDGNKIELWQPLPAKP